MNMTSKKKIIKQEQGSQKLENKIIVLLGHGSRLKSANQEFENLVKAYSQRWPELTILHAYLEWGEASIERRLKEAALLAHKERKALLLAPLLLFQGKHAQEDIPQKLYDLRKVHPEIEVYLSEPLGVHSALAKLAYKRACQTSLMANPRPEKTALLYFGRGFKDKKLRKDFERQALLFTGTQSFGFSQICFADMQKPSLREALYMSIDSSKMPQIENILILPHLLFWASLLKKAQKESQAFRAGHPQIRITLAQPLGSDELLFSVLDERIVEARSFTLPYAKKKPIV